MRSKSQFILLLASLLLVFSILALLRRSSLDRAVPEHEAAATSGPASASDQRGNFFRPWTPPGKRLARPAATNVDSNSLYIQYNVYSEPRTVIASNKYHSESTTSKHMVNTNVLARQVQAVGDLYERIRVRQEELGVITSRLKKGMTKSETIEAVGEEPAHKWSVGIYNYLVFSPHPERKMPDGRSAGFSSLFVLFDANDKTKEWMFSDKLPILPDQ